MNSNFEEFSLRRLIPNSSKIHMRFCFAVKSRDRGMYVISYDPPFSNDKRPTVESRKYVTSHSQPNKFKVMDIVHNL